MEAYLVDDLKSMVENAKGQSLDEAYVVFDLETTGFSPGVHKIIEIGAVRVEHAAVTGRFSSFVNPEVPIPYRIEEITKINDEMVMDARKIEEVLPEFYGRAGEGETDMRHPDVIVVDPPRKGCDEVTLETILKMQPERVVYVSCDSATLARDLKILCEGGYELKRGRVCDQFCHSVHIECVCLMTRKEK